MKNRPVVVTQVRNMSNTGDDSNQSYMILATYDRIKESLPNIRLVRGSVLDFSTVREKEDVVGQ
jgi:hypothetical protein